MQDYMKKTFLAVLFSTMLLTSCNNINFDSNKNLEDKGIITQTNVDLNKVDISKVDLSTLLVKREDKQRIYTKELEELGVKSVEPVSKTSPWFLLKLEDGIQSIEIFNKVRKLNYYNAIDLNYFYDCEDITTLNSTINSGQNNIDSNIQSNHYIQELWDYMDQNSPLDNNGNPITKAGGSSDIIVAVIDTGVDYTHPDLIANMWVNAGEIPNNFIDDDLNGYVDDYRGYNSITNTDEVMDNHGHGTHVAGIIAMSNNNIGGVGIAYNSKIMPIKVARSNSDGFLGTSADIAEAIEYAYLNGADIINMSFGGTMSSIVSDACANAYENTLLVASAGNAKKSAEPAHGVDPNDIQPNYPAALPYVVGVMANGSYTNYDPHKYTDVEYESRAWGENILSTFPGSRYVSMSGTSMAAPVVSGIAALIRSIYPNKSSFNTKTLFML